jgi:predicted TIM-barrel fold metal-dependent hydrolase
VGVTLERALDDLVDHHCHGILTNDLDRPAFEGLMNEAIGPSPLGTTLFDSALGWAIRRHCATVLDLEPLASAEEYLARRTELGGAEASRRLMGGTRIATLLVDTGLGPAELTPMDELAALCGGTAREIVRLERLAELVLAVSSDDFAGEVEDRLRTARAAGAVGAKSVAAYRVGLQLPATKPTADELRRALARVDPARLADPVVSGWLAHTAIEQGLPLQFHVGYGDSDVDLLRCDPLHLTPLLRATQPLGVPIMLLHNYPFHRHAAYLAQVFDHVFVDVGLAVQNVGERGARRVVGELLELAPFGSVLFSTDAFGLAELYLTSTALFRRALSAVLDEGLRDDAWTVADAERIANLIGADNARRAYRL